MLSQDGSISIESIITFLSVFFLIIFDFLFLTCWRSELKQQYSATPKIYIYLFICLFINHFIYLWIMVKCGVGPGILRVILYSDLLWLQFFSSLFDMHGEERRKLVVDGGEESFPFSIQGFWEEINRQPPERTEWSSRGNTVLQISMSLNLDLSRFFSHSRV